MAETSYEYVGGGNMVLFSAEPGEYEVGMALTMKDANMVGLGVTGGSPVFGIVTKVEERDGVVTAINTNTNTATVRLF